MTLRDRELGADVAVEKDRALRNAEQRMDEAAGAAMRRFLRRMREAVTAEQLTAAVDPSARLPNIAAANGWWEEAIDEDMASEVQQVWRAGYHGTRDGELTAGNFDRMGEHFARVKDRLSRTATPTIPEQAMNTARRALAEETARGSSIAVQSQRLAAEFGWDEDATFWRERLGELDGQIDRTLDAIGPPGDIAREARRLEDPSIRALQAERADARTRIDRVQSGWQTRAERIARTETTGAYNAGGRDAAATEGAKVKTWIATGDERTRDSHLDVSGECVPLNEPFDLFGAELDMPADPSGPAEETINCRCTLVYADSCEESQALYGDVEEKLNAERQRRGVSPREQHSGQLVDAVDDVELPPDALEPGGTGMPGGSLTERLDAPTDSSAYRSFGRSQMKRADEELSTAWRTDDGRLAINPRGDLDFDDIDEHLGAYQGADHVDINGALRGVSGRELKGQASYTRESIEALDEAVDSAPRVQQGIRVHRGVEGDFAEHMKNLPEGAKLDDPGFMSTSISADQAESFATAAGRIIDVEVPPGTRALYMNARQKTRFGAEMELLIGRGAQMEVVRQEAGRTVVRIVGFARDVV